MIEDMARNRPLYLQKHITRHGKVVWYVRVKRGPLIRIKAEYGTDEFSAQYTAVLAGQPVPKAKPSSASLQWLYDRYRESLVWSGLSVATRRQRENIFSHVMTKSGHEPFKAIDSSDVEAGKDDRKDTPAQARNYLDAMKGLFRWAKANNHVSVDPTLGVVASRRRAGDQGHPVWDMDDVDAFKKKWPVGTRQRVWFDLLFHTGLRRGDAVRAGKQHLKGGVITLATEKTGMIVHCVVLTELQSTLEVGPIGDLAFICGERGEPLTKESFGNMFRDACNKAGVKKSAHGLRKLAATQRAEAGYTDKELEAHFGWTGGYMASLYTRSANRKLLAETAAQKLMLAPEMQRLAPKKSPSKNNALKGAKSYLVRSRKVQ